ncbi:MAG: hypothetical protein V7696_05100 [Halioglobus sp.]
MTRLLFVAAFLLGTAAVIAMSANFVGSDNLALIITLVIAGVYVIGFVELAQFHNATASLYRGLSELRQTASDSAPDLSSWLDKLHPSLHNAVQSRVEGAQLGLPAPVITPYLVGLLVMLGLLGTFVGMVDTLKGAVVALEGTTELSAIRAGLAAPINGLSLAFGTSVAGIAASAMLGLASAVTRRDRMLATRQLDTEAARVFRDFSMTVKRRDTYNAMLDQANALPEMVVTLGTLTDRLGKMSEQLSENLLANQQVFHQAMTTNFKELAVSVDSSLKLSVTETARLTGESIGPLLQDTVAAITQEVNNTHQQLTTIADTQLQGLASQFGEMSSSWVARQQGEDQQRLERWHDTLTESQSQSAQQLVALSRAYTDELRELATHQEQTYTSTTETFTALSETLSGQWLQTSERMAELSLATGEQLQTLRTEEAERGEAAVARLGELSLATGGQLQTLRTEEAERGEAAVARLAELSLATGGQLQMLRTEEAERGEAAVARLAELESVVANHLANLGGRLEEPMTRLIKTASETPRAAAEVISQLREEIASTVARDNEHLEERRQIMKNLTTLSVELAEAARGQRDAVEGLVTASELRLEEVSGQFGGQVDTGLSKITALTDHFAGSTAQIAGLGESFTVAISLFNESNSALIENLSRIEDSMDKSSSRSDEQMSYYVAQAREIIDQSLLSQREVFEELRQLGVAESLAKAEAS